MVVVNEAPSAIVVCQSKEWAGEGWTLTWAQRLQYEAYVVSARVLLKLRAYNMIRLEKGGSVSTRAQFVVVVRGCWALEASCCL